MAFWVRNETVDIRLTRRVHLSSFLKSFKFKLLSLKELEELEEVKDLRCVSYWLRLWLIFKLVGLR